jgi:hypothetical protein
MEEMQMGVDTHGIINRKMDKEEVFNFIRAAFDISAEMRFSSNDRNFAYILFKDGIEDRQLVVMSSNDREINEHSDLEFEDSTQKDYVWLSLGHWGNSIDIMKRIIAHFGGYVDENDCDDEDYYFIPANSEGNIPPIIRVTMKEIYEKFGGIVIIKN